MADTINVLAHNGAIVGYPGGGGSGEKFYTKEEWDAMSKEEQNAIPHAFVINAPEPSKTVGQLQIEVNELDQDVEKAQSDINQLKIDLANKANVYNNSINLPKNQSYDLTINSNITFGLVLINCGNNDAWGYSGIYLGGGYMNVLKPISTGYSISVSLLDNTTIRITNTNSEYDVGINIKLIS